MFGFGTVCLLSGLRGNQKNSANLYTNF